MTEPQKPSPTSPPDERPPAMPRWVKLTGLVVLVLLVVLIIVMLLGGNHSPGRHTSAPSPEAHPAAAAGSVLPTWAGSSGW